MSKARRKWREHEKAPGLPALLMRNRCSGLHLGAFKWKTFRWLGGEKKNLCVNFAVERKQTSETGWKYCCLLSNRIGAAEEITCSSAMQLERKGGYWKFASNTKHSIWIKYKITIKTKVFLLFITVRIILDANNPTISEHLEQSTGHNTDRLQSESSSNLQLHTTP